MEMKSEKLYKYKKTGLACGLTFVGTSHGMLPEPLQGQRPFLQETLCFHFSYV